MKHYTFLPLALSLISRLAVAAGPDAFVVTPEWAAANNHVPVYPYDSWATAATNINDCVGLGGWRNQGYATIHVAPGHYYLAQSITNVLLKPYILRSDNGFPNGTGETDRDGTILDGMGERRVLYASNYSGDPENWWYNWIRMEGFTITNGYAATGAGGAVYMNGSHTNAASVAQGYTEPSLLENCRIVGNVAKTGNGGAVRARSLVLDRCELVANESTAGNGGAVYFETVKLTNDRFTPNDLGFAPGLVECTLSNNVCKSSGGAICSYAGSKGGSVVVSGCWFENNRATSPDSLGSTIGFTGPTGTESVDCGGGVYGSTFSDESNSSARRGHVYCRGRNLTVDGCTFRSTGVLSGKGQVYSENAETIVSNCRFLDCNGPALNGSGTIRQCLVAGGIGDGIRISGTSLVEACTIVGRQTKGNTVKDAPAILVPQKKLVNSTDTAITETVDVGVTNCVFWGNASGGFLDNTDDGVASFAAANSCIDGWTGGTANGMVAADPKFADAANGDYSLRVGSPCVDKGAVLPWMSAGSTDLAGLPRVKFAAPDMGAFECQTSFEATVLSIR